MSITVILRDWGQGVSIVRVISTNTLAEVGTAGYLTAQADNISAVNFGPFEWALTDMVLVSASDGWGFFTISSDFASLTPFVFIPDVATPTILDHIAVYTGTGGTLGEDAATAINGGNIQAGLSGTAGYVASFPATGSKGSLRLTAVANTGDTLVTISNAAHGQASVYSIPDSGASTANFILSKTTGTQHITVGSLQVDGGNLTAGISGTAGTVTSFPGTAANGSLILAAVNAGGAFNTTISNGTMGQSTVYSLGDIGASTGGIPVATSAIRVKSVAGAAAAGGNAAQSFTDTFCTSGSNVIGNWNTQANAASVLKIVPGNGSFVVTSSADAGVGTFNYIITK